MLCKNRLTLIGFIGQDAETRSTPNSDHYARLSLATSNSWKDSSTAEYMTRTEWHRVICRNKLARLGEQPTNGRLHRGRRRTPVP